MAPVGREFGSPDYERLMEQDRVEIERNLSKLIATCSELVKARSGDVEAEERRDAVTVQTALQELGQNVSLVVAAEVWRHYSNAVMTSWMSGAETIASAKKTIWLYCMRTGNGVIESGRFKLDTREIEVASRRRDQRPLDDL